MAAIELRVRLDRFKRRGAQIGGQLEFDPRHLRRVGKIIIRRRGKLLAAQLGRTQGRDGKRKR